MKAMATSTKGTRQILIMMLGHPGSGKSYFTRQLAPKIGAVRFNGDHMRMAMFKDLTNVTRDDNPKIFGAIDYAVEQVLQAGHSVIYDAQHNKRWDRDKNREIAAKFGVPCVTVWIKTPYEVALKRGIEREETHDQRRKTEEQMRASIDFFMDEFEALGPDELCIILDGTEDFEEQYKSFTEQLQKLMELPHKTEASQSQNAMV